MLYETLLTGAIEVDPFIHPGAPRVIEPAHVGSSISTSSVRPIGSVLRVYVDGVMIRSFARAPFGAKVRDSGILRTRAAWFG